VSSEGQWAALDQPVRSSPASTPHPSCLTSFQPRHCVSLPLLPQPQAQWSLRS
jgi:hypothetical protein